MNNLTPAPLRKIPKGEPLDLQPLSKCEDRRGFLKMLGKIAIAAAVCRAIPLSADEIIGETDDPDWGLHRWGMAVDVNKCIGCGRCIVACKNENNVPNKPEYFRTWIERYREYDDETIVDSPNGGYDGFPPDEDNEREPYTAFFVPKLCNHCEQPPCVQVCPVGATFKSPDGVVLVDPSYCIGCRYCIQACPYGARFLNPITESADKCTFCYHRIHKDLKPACVESCPTGARTFGDLKNPDDPVSVFRRTHRIQVMKPHLNTFPKVYYNGTDMEVR